MKTKVYLAGPLFTHAERLWNRELAAAIRRKDKSISIFLPQEETKAAFSEGAPNFAKLHKICLNGIDSSNVVIAILDGSDADSGTCFECGYAFAKEKLLIGIRTDLRAGEDEGLNAMLSKSCRALVRFDATKDGLSDLDVLANKVVNSIIAHLR